MKRTIENCSLQKKYGEAGLKDGKCAGIRTDSGNGEPCDTCKECKLQYQYDEQMEVKHCRYEKMINKEYICTRKTTDKYYKICPTKWIDKCNAKKDIEGRKLL